MRMPADRNGPATRHEIVNTLRHEPGITKSQLCRRLGLAWGTISHHVQLLETTGVVERQRINGRKRLFLAGLSREEQAWSQLVRSLVVPELVRRIEAQPGIGIHDLANALRLNRRLVRRNLDRLIESGLVGQTTDYRPRFFVVERQRALQLVLEAQSNGPLAPRPRP